MQFTAAGTIRIIAEDIIKQVTTEPAAPILSAPNQDGLLDFCIVYRKLKAATTCHSYLLHGMEESMYSLGEATMYFALNSRAECRELGINEYDLENTAFTSHDVLYRSSMIIFRLKNAV